METSNRFKWLLWHCLQQYKITLFLLSLKVLLYWLFLQFCIAYFPTVQYIEVIHNKQYSTSVWSFQEKNITCCHENMITLSW
jgi:hypothetical protein